MGRGSEGRGGRWAWRLRRRLSSLDMMRSFGRTSAACLWLRIHPMGAGLQLSCFTVQLSPLVRGRDESHPRSHWVVFHAPLWSVVAWQSLPAVLLFSGRNRRVGEHRSRLPTWAAWVASGEGRTPPAWGRLGERAVGVCPGGRGGLRMGEKNRPHGGSRCPSGVSSQPEGVSVTRPARRSHRQPPQGRKMSSDVIRTLVLAKHLREYTEGTGEESSLVCRSCHNQPLAPA